MIEARLPAYPLITIDPLFSIWSTTDKLYESETQMWTKAEKPIHGNINIDGVIKRFMGTEGAEEVIEQTKLELSLTSTRYTFEDEKIRLILSFTSPFLLEDPALASCPLAFINLAAESKDGKAHDIQIILDFDEKLVYEDGKKLTRGGILPYPDGKIGYLGRVLQRSLNSAGDKKEVDWGWLYLAGESEILLSGISAKKRYFKKNELEQDKNYRKVLMSEKSAVITAEKPLSYTLILAYDDIYSINYFGQYKKGYWKTRYYSIVNAIQENLKEHQKTLKKLKNFDDKTEDEILKRYGATYLTLLAAAYRQTLAAHKMVSDGKDILYFSKECSSNGCLATVDVSYPSAPLFLINAPALVKGMLIPVLNFSRMKSWPFEFAPHDAGIYPYCTGQVYGANPVYKVKTRYTLKKHIYKNYGNSKIYTLSQQMPVEECGNILILCAAYFNETGDLEFIRENADLLSKWADYLVGQGVTLGAQLTTDDFSGTSENNVNLAIKGVTGIAVWGLLLNKIQPSEGNKYLETASNYAKELERISGAGEHLTHTIKDRKSWSLKYNLVWDKLFRTNLFSSETFIKETELYKKKLNKYGVPLDSNTGLTKSDWMMFATALSDDDSLTIMFADAVKRMLSETKDRVPFTDLYDSVTGEQKDFCHRSVQGALWIAEYKRHLEENKGHLF